MSARNSLLINDADTGVVRNATDEEVIRAACACVAPRMRRGSALDSPKAAKDYLMLRLGELPHEVFCVIYLDNRNRVIECQELFRGTINGASVYPREVVREALQRNAAACLFAHNHPSGVAEPSQADELITHRLRDALSLVDIRVIDHLVVSSGDAVSMAERGLL